MTAINPCDQQHELQLFVHSLVNKHVCTQPQHISSRNETRLSRTMPALIVPMQDDELDITKTLFVVTKDLSSGGAALISQTALETDQIVVGLWNDSQCRFAEGTICYRCPIEAGFWQFGVQFIRLISLGEFESLTRLTELASRLTSHAV